MDVAADGSAFPPFTEIAGDSHGGLIVLCDHASNALPPAYGTLGLPPGELARHIAYDPGAAAVAKALAKRLNAPAVLSGFSRLLIDPNRGEDDPTLIMRLSDGAVVPGNQQVDGEERARRIAGFHAPYHAAIERAIEAAFAARKPPALVSIHSFTPVWRGVRRPWQVGVLWDKDPRLAVPLIARLADDASLTVGDNEPYHGALKNDCLYRHGTAGGLAHALIEIRQDLIAGEAGVAEWSVRLATILAELNHLPDMHHVRYFGSLTGPVETF